MRLDKFLQTSRIIKRRTVAAKVCNSGRVRVNDRPAKAGKELVVGDRLMLTFGSGEELVCEVLEVPRGAVRKDEAARLYRTIRDTRRKPGEGT